MAAKPDRNPLPTYENPTDDPVLVQQFDVIQEADGGSWIIRAVPLPLIIIDPGMSADLPQLLDGNVLEMVPDPGVVAVAATVTATATAPTVTTGP